MLFPKPSSKPKKRSQKKIFLEVWNTKPHICEKCGKCLNNPKTHNFDHILPKGMNKGLKYDPNNIMIICYGCHYEKTFGGVYKGIDLDI